MIPEDRLFAAIIDNAVDASLREPVGKLPDYKGEIGSKQWVRIRDKRRELNEKEENRLDGKERVNSAYLAILYKMVYHTSIEPLRLLLQNCWSSIEANPEKSLHYRKIFDKKSQSMADRREWHET